MIIPAQIRAARSLLNLKQSELAALAGVTTMTIKRAEGSGFPPTPDTTNARLKEILEAQGVEFLPAGTAGEGVRFTEPQGGGTDSSVQVDS